MRFVVLVGVMVLMVLGCGAESENEEPRPGELGEACVESSKLGEGCSALAVAAKNVVYPDDAGEPYAGKVAVHCVELEQGAPTHCALFCEYMQGATPAPIPGAGELCASLGGSCVIPWAAYERTVCVLP